MTTEKTPVSLMAEAVATYNDIKKRSDTLCRIVEINSGSLVKLMLFHDCTYGQAQDKMNEYIQLERIKEKSFSRYLRRWADARENGYQGDWFDPWLPQKASK